MVEGNNLLAPILNQTEFPYEIALVGDEKKEVIFHSHPRFTTGGSIYKEMDYEKFSSKKLSEVKKTMGTIDDIVARNKLGRIDFLKLDIQGAEYIALNGALATLKDVEVVLLETAIHQYNVGAHTFFDINIFLEKQGFRLYDRAIYSAPWISME